jgi:hypothetical protein
MVAVSQALGEALIERAGIGRDAGGLWIDRQGRHTSAVSETLIWALVAIAGEAKRG